MTDPAKELAARLPGPVPWSVDDNGHEEWIADAGGKPIDFGKVVAWVNEAAAQLAAISDFWGSPGHERNRMMAQLAAKDAEIERLEAESRKHFADGLAFLKRLNTAEGQLAAATLRIENAEKVIAPFAVEADGFHSDISGGFEVGNHLLVRDFRGARSWLTQGKDGETDAEG